MRYSIHQLIWLKTLILFLLLRKWVIRYKLKALILIISWPFSINGLFLLEQIAVLVDSMIIFLEGVVGAVNVLTY